MFYRTSGWWIDRIVKVNYGTSSTTLSSLHLQRILRLGASAQTSRTTIGYRVLCNMPSFKQVTRPLSRQQSLGRQPLPGPGQQPVSSTPPCWISSVKGRHCRDKSSCGDPETPKGLPTQQVKRRSLVEFW